MRSIRTKTEAPCSQQSVRGGTGARRLAYAVLVAGTLTAACRGGVAPPLGTDRDVPPERGGTLRTAFFTDVRGLDAATAFDTADHKLVVDRKGAAVMHHYGAHTRVGSRA